MANTHETLTGLFTDIADAIREKTGSTDSIVADNFPEAIGEIETCPDNALFLEESNELVLNPRGQGTPVVLFAQNEFKAIDDGGPPAFSPDGINWTVQNNYSNSMSALNDALYTSSKFVAVTGSSKQAYCSTDARYWIKVSLPASQNWTGVAYGGAKFVAIASNATTAAVSSNGLTWTKTTMPASVFWWKVVYGGDKFVAVSTSATGAYSTDGSTWTKMTMPQSGQWRCLAYGGDKFVAIAANTNTAAYSTDGITWTTTTMPTTAPWWTITYGNGKFIAVAGGAFSASDVAAYSTDGITWHPMTMATASAWYDVAYGKTTKGVHTYVTVSTDSGDINYSTDGVTWQNMGVKTKIVDSTGADRTAEVLSKLQ